MFSTTVFKSAIGGLRVVLFPCQEASGGSVQAEIPPGCFCLGLQVLEDESLCIDPSLQSHLSTDIPWFVKCLQTEGSEVKSAFAAEWRVSVWSDQVESHS